MIYAVADLHLSFGSPKPMDIFGESWKNHENKIKKNWEETIKESDVILLPGDFSWAMTLEDTCKDFEYLSKLPRKENNAKGKS